MVASETAETLENTLSTGQGQTAEQTRAQRIHAEGDGCKNSRNKKRG